MTLLILTQAEDVTDRFLEFTAELVESRYPAGYLNADEFIDHFCDVYLNREGWDIESLDTPAVRKIMRHARRVQREIT